MTYKIIDMEKLKAIFNEQLVKSVRMVGHRSELSIESLSEFYEEFGRVDESEVFPLIILFNEEIGNLSLMFQQKGGTDEEPPTPTLIAETRPQLFEPEVLKCEQCKRLYFNTEAKVIMDSQSYPLSWFIDSELQREPIAIEEHCGLYPIIYLVDLKKVNEYKGFCSICWMKTQKEILKHEGILERHCLLVWFNSHGLSEGCIKALIKSEKKEVCQRRNLLYLCSNHDEDYSKCTDTHCSFHGENTSFKF